ncbi:hypothetical protein Rhopal_003894-T1 [Rhodotorula paludigena]|uniref:Proteasome subunit beta n=1 Tax=Rhodotorula paludigena TaxID=86838 RepID=A0AAV5GLY4_9BASI|nr:hypothetical protein Rhopal_003894-T1 [Rhodotorula paludigena]
MKGNEDKQKVVGKHLVMACDNHIPLRPPSAAAWLATSLRSRKPYSVNLLLGGFDPTTAAPSLYWIDYLGTLGVVPYAAHGYGAYFALSTMDRWHDPNADLAQGLDLLKKCIFELETRFIVNLGGWTIRVADKDGVRQINLDGTPYEPPVPPPVAGAGAAEHVEAQPQGAPAIEAAA